MDRFSSVSPRVPFSSPGQTPPASPRRSLSQSSITLGQSLSDQAPHTTPTTAPSVVASSPPPSFAFQEQLRAAIDREDIEAVQKCLKEHPKLKEAFFSVSEKSNSKEYKTTDGKTKYADPVQELSCVAKNQYDWKGGKTVRAVKKIIDSFFTTFFDKGRYGGCTLLTYAILKGKSVGFISDLIALCDDKSHLNIPDGAGRLPLCLAVESGNEKLITLFLPYCNLEAKNGQGLTPAMVAVRSGKYTLVADKRLLGESPSPEHLHALACIVVLNVPAQGENNDAFIFLKSLFDKKGFDPKKTDNKGRTLLHLVAEEGMPNPRLLDFLFERDVPLDEKDGFGKTVLYHAVNSGNVDFFKLILSKIGPKCLGEKDYDYKTLLHYALEKGHSKIAERIVETDPERIKDVGPQGLNCLHLAAQGGKLDCFKLILSQPGGRELLQRRNKKDKTPLHVALKNCHLDIVQLILEIDPEQVNHRDANENTLLHLAAQGGNLECFKLIYEHLGGDALKERNRTGETVLHVALKKGRLDIVQLILEIDPARIKDVSPYDGSCLHLAARGGNLEAFKLILSQIGGDALKERNDEGETPLYLALGYANKEIVKHILEIDPEQMNDKDAYGNTLLHLAARGRNLECFKLIYEHLGGDALKERNDEGETPLYLALGYANKEIVKHILEIDPEQMNDKDAYGNTLLHLAARGRNLECFKLIYEHLGGREFLQGRNKKDKTPLHVALLNGRFDIVQHILEIDPEQVNCLDDHGNTLLHVAVQGGNLNFFKWILEQEGGKQFLKERNDEGETPLYLALGYTNNEIIKHILKMDPEQVNCLDDDGNTLLHLAAREGNLNFFKWILEQEGGKQFLKERNDKGQTPLYLALGYTNNEIIKHILEMDPEQVNYRDANGNTLLHLAARGGNLECFKLIYEHLGGDVLKERNHAGDTVLDLALYYHNKKIVDFINNLTH